MVVNSDRFTKHYYAGSQRIASKIGAGEFNNLYDASKACVTAGQKDYAERMNLITQSRNDYYAALGIPPGPPTAKGIYGEAEYSGAYGDYSLEPLGNYDVPSGWPMKPYKRPYGGTPGPPVMYEKPSDPEDEGAGYGYSNAENIQEKDIYFYQSDHLGSTNYITDKDGNATQFVSYKPYGEALVDEHATSFESPWKFNGKELDSETGLYYYGARYYEPVLALWYGVDALAEKYPNMGGYVYCAGNPVKLVDPDGNDWVESENGGCVWNENVNSKLETPKGFRYIGTDSDLLAYMGLWEQFSDMSTNTIGYVDCDPSVGCHMTNLQVKSHLDINIMKDGDNKLSGISIVSTNVSSNTGSSEGQIVEKSRMSINYGGNKLSATLVPITNEDIFYKTGTTVTKASITIPSRLLCHNKKLESVCVEGNWSVIDPSTKRHHTFVITHGLFPTPKTYNHTWENRTKSSRVHSIFDSYCRFNNHLWNLLMPNVRK